MISTKGRYALKVMVELAEHDAEEYIPLKGIAEKLNISQKYLESISAILSKGHMIEGVSGKKGGYRLKRKPEEYGLVYPAADRRNASTGILLKRRPGAM